MAVLYGTTIEKIIEMSIDNYFKTIKKLTTKKATKPNDENI